MNITIRLRASKVKTRSLVATSVLFLMIVVLLILVSCSASAQPGPVEAVESYQDALIAGNADQLVNASCAEWESQARLELDSFTAVTTQLEDRTCQEAGKDGDVTLVDCSGVIKANYGAEVLAINLADRTYQTVYEGGEWRMCGYR